ncbi:MAG TPA: DUF5916 domain-containing protein [Gemmatimonadota bacterium]|nr:DUF5916 domain-containing protein [Gemmatimonadota bacterium]
MAQPAAGGEEGQAAAKRIEALRASAGTPEVDGRLDDPVWAQARWISDFVQKEPVQGAAPTVATEIAFVYDDEAVYIGARMAGEGTYEIADQMTRRDDMARGADRLIVSLDTYHDGRTAYSFAVTAAGVRIDWHTPTDHEGNHDMTFDAVWAARTEVTAEGWTAEMRIPFSQLRFSSADEQVWGVNVNRTIPALDEEQYWVLVPRDETGWASRFGELVGIRGVGASRRIELVPYVASEVTRTSDALIAAGDPFSEINDATVRTGLDFKMGLGPNLTLNATVNPDFGQVEADPAEVNLTAFETFFQERRPFFTEGQQNLQGNGPPYYYSRRIGAAPHLFAGGDFRDAPSTSTILGAAKVTGQLAGGWSLGAITAYTDDESARVYDLAEDAFRDVDVEPATLYGAARLQKQFGPNASTFAFTLTAVDRSMDEGSALASLLADRALAGGVDWNRRFQGGKYELLGQVGFSHVTGDSAAITRIQRSSGHYFQRPDQDHVELDPSATSMTGFSAAVRGGKRSGTWQWNGGVWGDTQGFEINDLGQYGRADEIAQWSGVSYNVTTPGNVFRRWNVGMFENASFNNGWIHRNQNLGMSTNYTLTNFYRGFFETGRNFDVLSDVATRGGPLMKQDGNWWFAGGVFSSANQPSGWGIRAMVGSEDLGGWRWRIDPEARWQPTDRIRLSFTPRYVRSRDTRQYVGTFEGGRDATFGSRYVFGWIDRSEIATPVRMNYLFTPNVSLELYAEPFAASGRYFDLGELAAPRTSDLRTYGEAEGTSIERDETGAYTVTDGDASFEIANRDFDVLSFRSNLVLRWEWRPGSSLFVVWQQNRSGFDAAGRLVGGGDLLDSLSADGQNVLAVKFSYWLPL